MIRTRQFNHGRSAKTEPPGQREPMTTVRHALLLSGHNNCDRLTQITDSY